MNRLIIVSNRLPFALDSAGEDLWTVTPAVGGLVSAVEPVLRERGGTWIGWPGTAGEIPNEPLAKATRDAGYNVVPVALSETERDEFYYGYLQRGDLAAVSRSAEFLQFRPGVLAGLQASKRTVCGCDHPQCPARRFHLGPRLSPDVRCPGIARTKRVYKSSRR